MESRRVTETKNLLKDALLDLVEEKPLDKVTVRELCERAGVHRSTFYNHYDSPGQLFQEMEDELQQKAPKAVIPHPEKLREELQETLIVLFDYVRESRRMFALMLKEGKHTFFRQWFEEVFDRSGLDYLVSPGPMKACRIIYYSYGLSGLMRVQTPRKRTILTN